MNELDPRLYKLIQSFKLAEPLAQADLVGKERLGQLNFERELHTAQKLLHLSDELRELPLEELPSSRLQTLESLHSKAVNTLQRMRDFQISQSGNPAEAHNQIIGALRTNHDELFTFAAPLIAYLRTSPALLTAFEQKQSEIVSVIDQAKASSESNIRQLEKEAQEILAAMRRAAAEVGVSQHAVHFLEQAREHLAAARYWMVATIGVALFAIGAASVVIYYYYRSVQSFDTATGIQLAVAKLVLFSIIYFAILWCSRNYRAHRHNYVLAKHRQNALGTFQTFVKAATDEPTRNAVLLRATEAIFSPALSGYMPGEPEPQGGTQILEIFRGSVSKGGVP